MQTKFFQKLADDYSLSASFLDIFQEDIIAAQSAWTDEPQELVELLHAASKTKEGRALILFLVGFDKMSTYIEYVEEHLGIASETDEDDEL